MAEQLKNNYTAAEQDFTVRSGLVDKDILLEVREKIQQVRFIRACIELLNSTPCAKLSIKAR